MALAVATFGIACWRPVVAGIDGQVDRAPAGSDAVRLVYLGVGGWILERGSAQILTAPLFSNPSFVRTGLGAIRSDTAAVDGSLRDHDLSRASAILVGHAHYDHLMDVPRVALRHAPAARILGSRVVENTLGSWSGVGDRVVRIDSLAGDVERAGVWIDVADGVRVMPLRSHHAPHFDGYTLYRGTTDRPRSQAPANAAEWLDGPTYAFLIDFLDPDGSVAFRLYYQDAVAAPPAGFAPKALVAERPVDAAILVPATFDQVDWHPEALIENLAPRWVLLGHWETFFVPPGPPAHAVPLSDIRHFQDRLARVLGDGEAFLPEIGTVFRLPVGQR